MVQRECRTSVGKTKSALLAQVKETGNRRAKRRKWGQNEGRCVEVC